MIKLSVLSENRTHGCFEGEEGLSILVEYNDHKFLFDTGRSDLFTKNARLMGVDLDEVKNVVLSHGHMDHTAGLSVLKNKNIIMHPSAFKERWSISKKINATCPVELDKLLISNNVNLTMDAVQFAPKCYFLGEVPMVVDFESKGNFATTLDSSFTQTDYTEDDSGVAIKTPNGLFILTGCGHRGICNTIEHAIKVTGESKIWGVLGGLHLRKLEKHQEVIDKTIAYLTERNVKNVFLGHCVTDEVIAYFERNMAGANIYRMHAGATFELDSKK